MANLMIKGEALLVFIFGIMITVAMWYWVPIISNILPHVILTALFWIGLVSCWGLTVIATPISMIINGKGSAKKGILGLLAFFVATFISYLSYFVVPPLIDIFMSADNAMSANNGSIFWIGLGVFWFIGMVLIPMYIIGSGLTRKIEEGGPPG